MAWRHWVVHPNKIVRPMLLPQPGDQLVLTKAHWYWHPGPLP